MVELLDALKIRKAGVVHRSHAQVAQQAELRFGS